VRALLDTHAFLWFNSNDPRMSGGALALIEDGENEIVLSAVSALEIAIKYARGRLPEVTDPDSYVPSRMARYGLGSLAISIPHALRAGVLPPIHRDPFDRLLVAQAQLEGLPILTSDANIARYDIQVIW